MIEETLKLLSYDELYLLREGLLLRIEELEKELEENVEEENKFNILETIEQDDYLINQMNIANSMICDINETLKNK
jgi:hypothetical protein